MVDVPRSAFEQLLGLLNALAILVLTYKLMDGLVKVTISFFAFGIVFELFENGIICLVNVMFIYSADQIR